MYQENCLTMVATNTTSIMFNVTRLLDIMMRKKARPEYACDWFFIDYSWFKLRIERSYRTIEQKMNKVVGLEQYIFPEFIQI